MPDLYISALGSPFRAVVASVGGECAFVKIGDRPEDDFSLEPLVWIDSDGAITGTQAGFLSRSGAFGELFRVTVVASISIDSDDAPFRRRDLLAVVLRRILIAAELQSGEPMQRVTLVVPALLPEAAQSTVLQAMVLAGAQQVEIRTLDDVFDLPPAAKTVSSPCTVIVEAWDDGSRMTVIDGSRPSARVRIFDLSAKLALEHLRKMLQERITPEAQHIRAPDPDLIRQAFRAWSSGADISHGISLMKAAVRTGPEAIHIPAAIFANLDHFIGDRLERVLRGYEIEVENIVCVHVLGSWTKPIAKALRSSIEENVVLRYERGMELDAAIKRAGPEAPAPKPSLTSDILAVSPTARTLRAVAQGEEIVLLRAGTRLPATSVSEDFNSSSFIHCFQIATRKEGTTTPLSVVTIPRYAERQRNSYFRIVVHNCTRRFIFTELAYLYSTQRVFSIYDRATAVAAPVADHVVRVIRG